MSPIVVTGDDAGKRLDVFVTEHVSDISRATAQKLIRTGMVNVDDKAEKISYKVSEDQQVAIEYAEEQQIPDISLTVIYEDEDCLVIDKPVGVLTHSKGAFNPEATVATFIQQHSKQVSGERSGIVHRLDRATSGVMICAKTPEALSWLQKQFSSRKVKKTYIAVVDKPISPDHAIIDMPIERNPKKPQTFRVGNNGKSAVTEYQVIRTDHDKTMLELKPTTGRTHQLRVHLVEMGCPIIGDTLYGGTVADRMFLHAQKLEITLPNRERRVFESVVPDEFERMMG